MRLIGADEGGTLEPLRALRREVLDPKIAEHKGRLVKTTADGLPVEFGSVVNALRCAVERQHEMAGNNAGLPPDNRIELVHLGDDFHSVVAHYGFMQHPNVPRVLERCGTKDLQFDMMDTSFFVGRVTLVPERKSRFGASRCKLFEAMHRNALPATEFFRIPPNRVIELGSQMEI